MTRRSRRVLTVLGVLAAVGLVSAAGYGVARAAARPREPRYPTPPGQPTAPLRPAPASSGDPQPGPLAARLGELVTELDDAALVAARNAMPATWWPAILDATRQATDEAFSQTLQPIGVDLVEWTDDQRQQLERDLVSSMGFTKALTLRGILQDAGVL